MLEVGVYQQIIERRILVEPLSVLPGPESVVELTGVIWRELWLARSSIFQDR